MLKTEDTQLTIYSLKHKKHGEVSTCIQSYSPGFNTDSMWVSCGWMGKPYNRKENKRRKQGRLSGGLLLVWGVPVKVVGHEENVGSRWDEGMARFHNLKAQETEGTHQFSWNEKVDTLKWLKTHKSKLTLSYRVDTESNRWGKKKMLAHTTIISVLVKADKHANDFQMFFSILQESCETAGRTEGSLA